MLKRIPAALLAGLVLGVLPEIITLFADLGPHGLDSTARWALFSMGSYIAESILVTVGLFDLARRATGTAHRALSAAATLSLIVAVWVVARPLVEIVGGEQRALFTFYRWSFFATGLASLAIAILLAVAARGRAHLAIALAVLGVLGRGWIPGVTDELHRWLWEHRLAGDAYHLAIAAMWCAGALGLAWEIAYAMPEPGPEPAVAAAGFRRLAGALRFRIVAAIVIAVVGIGLLRSIAASKAVIIGGPLAILACMIVGALGALAVARAAVEGMPRLRIVVGAAITLWWCGVQADQMVWLYRAFDENGPSGMMANQEMIATWTILGPLLATAGIAMIGSAISAYASARANDELREAASVRTLLFVVLSASAVGIQSQVYKASTRDGFLMLMFVAAAAGIGALVAFAGLATQAASTLDQGGTLPTARVVDPT